ncbi:DNA modification methylase [Pyrodictium delaneyi]|uniref:DNA modification methylase n=1 Tax=Pyrodictium delaneyi TaxID=1273541 RepID=A0A0P0N1X3_9CREN|nr:RNA methyltransferase [Pyrodictium delaneyi]ALL00399.1 DNA modification methylase [Pyrodictium delaneyi]
MTRLYYALLSGLHASLPLAELRGILEALGHRYQVVEVLDQLAVFKCSCEESKAVAWRAGLVHETGRVLAATEARLGDVLEALEYVDWCNIVGQDDRVRVELHRVRGYARSTLPDDTARRAAQRLEALLRPCGAVAAAREPTKTLRIIVTEGAAVLGLREGVQPKKLLEEHRPQRRPFFHPGSLDPRLARLFVNLSRAAPPGPYLDPFCGTGGFALEAQTLGIPTICGELATRLAEGAHRNLRAYPGEALTETLQWDATKLPLRDETVQSIGTDPPYGRSISLRGKPLQTLLQNFLQEAARVLQPGAYLAYATPHWAEDKAIEYTEQAGLQPLEKHYMRVHGSLTRVIILARK